MSATAKICHITSAHHFNDVRIFHKECSSLAAAGYDVALIAPNCENQIKNGVKIFGVTNKGQGRIYRMLFHAKHVYHKALDYNADIYHFHDPEFLPFALRLKRKGKKVIYDVHEDLPRQIKSKYWIPSIFRNFISFLFEKYENYIGKRMDAVIAATPLIRNRFLALNANCIEICNYPILQEVTIEKKPSTDSLEICYIGGITRIRGIVELIKALENSDVKLNLAGEYSPPSLKSELASMAGWKNVIEFGFVGREKVYEILSRSFVGIVTLYPQPNYLDALPIKMFEYMNAGIPVISSDFPLWKEIVEGNNCGICVNPLSPVEINKAINFLGSNKEIAEEMGRHGKKAILEKYNWSIEEKKLLEIYNKIVC